jgi:hypothetical protein
MDTPTGAAAESGWVPGAQRGFVDADTGHWGFTPPGHQKIIDDANNAQQAAAEAVAAEPGTGPGTFEDRAQMTPHPYSFAFRAIPLGDQLPPMNLPPEIHHFLATQIDKLGFRHHAELQQHTYEAPPGIDHPSNPGTWVPVGEAADLPTDNPGVAAPDLMGTHPDTLNAMETAIKAERIRQLKIHHADPHAREAMGVGGAPLVVPERRRLTITPPASQPIPNTPASDDTEAVE